MEFFKTNNPAYKRAQVAKAATKPTVASRLSGLIGSLFGSETPSYKTADGQGAKSYSPSNGLLSMFAVEPSYKDGSPVAAPAASVDESEHAEFAQVTDTDQTGADDGGAICELAPDEIVLL